MSKKLKSIADRAIKLAGGPVKLSKELKIRPQAVSQWQQCPVQHVLKIEGITGISRHELRPDIYGPVP